MFGFPKQHAHATFLSVPSIDSCRPIECSKDCPLQCYLRSDHDSTKKVGVMTDQPQQ